MDYNDALELATRKHEGQFRKHTGEPYISHPIAVADKFVDDTLAEDGIIHIDEDCRLVAILHDTIEDTDLTVHALRYEYGLDEHLIESLIAITRKESETYLDFILRCKGNKNARGVKIEDILHNLTNLEKGNMRDKYAMALYILDI